jgi:hypothetical protein
MEAASRSGSADRHLLRVLAGNDRVWVGAVQASLYDRLGDAGRFVDVAEICPVDVRAAGGQRIGGVQAGDDGVRVAAVRLASPIEPASFVQ